jgi:hypothetical protein
MSKEELDHLFKNKLQDHTRIPSAEAWDRLEKELEKKENPRAFTWWHMAAAITLLAVAGVIFWQQKSDPQMIADTKEVVEIDSTSEALKNGKEADLLVSEDSAPKAVTTEEESELKQIVPSPQPQVAQNTPQQQETRKELDKAEQQRKGLPSVDKDNIATLTEKTVDIPTVNPSEMETVEVVAKNSPAQEDNLRFSIEEFDEALITNNGSDDSTTNAESKKKGFKKLWASVKTGQFIETGIGDLREAKDELLSFNKEETEKP